MKSYLIVLLSILNISTQFRIVFWNLENFFIDSGHFYEKAHNISKQIYLISEELPTFIGVAEVGSFNAVWRLVNLTSLMHGGYSIVHRESPDHRGIEVALLYRREHFRPITNEFISIYTEDGKLMRTRDILYTKGVLSDLDTLHLFVMHWPSKWGGEKASLPLRRVVAGSFSKLVDSILLYNPLAKIVAMGDLNDGAAQVGKWLYNMTVIPPSIDQARGTIKYNGNWEVIDHFIVSAALLDKRSAIYSQDSSYIFSNSLLIERDRAYTGYKPRRSFIGPRYNGGISDHLPIVLIIYNRR